MNTAAFPETSICMFGLHAASALFDLLFVVLCILKKHQQTSLNILWSMQREKPGDMLAG